MSECLDLWNAPRLMRSLTTVGIPNAARLLEEIKDYRGSDSSVYLAHADDGTCVRLYGRTVSLESIEDTMTFPGTRSDAITYMLSERLWERPGTYVFLCDTGDKVWVTFV